MQGRNAAAAQRVPVDVYATVKDGLLGKWVDSRDATLDVIPNDEGA